MDSLRKLHHAAEEIELTTAEELGYADTANYSMGPLLITCVHLEDIGLKGRTDKTRVPHEEAYEVEDISEAMAALGLPASFAGKGKQSTARGQPRQKQEGGAWWATPGDGTPDIAELDISSMTWQQIELLYGAGSADKLLAAAKLQGSNGSASNGGATGGNGSTGAGGGGGSNGAGNGQAQGGVRQQPRGQGRRDSEGAGGKGGKGGQREGPQGGSGAAQAAAAAAAAALLHVSRPGPVSDESQTSRRRSQKRASVTPGDAAGMPVAVQADAQPRVVVTITPVPGLQGSAEGEETVQVLLRVDGGATAGSSRVLAKQSAGGVAIALAVQPLVGAVQAHTDAQQQVIPPEVVVSITVADASLPTSFVGPVQLLLRVGGREPTGLPQGLPSEQPAGGVTDTLAMQPEAGVQLQPQADPSEVLITLPLVEDSGLPGPAPVHHLLLHVASEGPAVIMPSPAGQPAGATVLQLQAAGLPQVEQPSHVTVRLALSALSLQGSAERQEHLQVTFVHGEGGEAASGEAAGGEAAGMEAAGGEAAREEAAREEAAREEAASWKAAREEAAREEAASWKAAREEAAREEAASWKAAREEALSVAQVPAGEAAGDLLQGQAAHPPPQADPPVAVSITPVAAGSQDQESVQVVLRVQSVQTAGTQGQEAAVSASPAHPCPPSPPPPPAPPPPPPAPATPCRLPSPPPPPCLPAPSPPPPAGATPPPFPPPPPLHPALAALPASAIQWQQLPDGQGGAFFYNLLTRSAQPHPPPEGFVPLHLKDIADAARGIAAHAAHAHAPPVPQPPPHAGASAHAAHAHIPFAAPPPHAGSPVPGPSRVGSEVQPAGSLQMVATASGPMKRAMTLEELERELSLNAPTNSTTPTAAPGPPPHHPSASPHHPHQHHHAYHLSLNGWPQPLNAADGRLPPPGLSPQPPPHGTPPYAQAGPSRAPPPGYAAHPSPSPPPRRGTPPPGFGSPYATPASPGFSPFPGAPPGTTTATPLQGDSAAYVISRTPLHATPAPVSVHAHASHQSAAPPGLPTAAGSPLPLRALPPGNHLSNLFPSQSEPRAQPPPHATPPRHSAATPPQPSSRTSTPGHHHQRSASTESSPLLDNQPPPSTGKPPKKRLSKKQSVGAAAAANASGRATPTKGVGGGSHCGSVAGGDEGEVGAGGVERVVLDADIAAHLRSTLPRNVVKYWLQRYSLFAKYDDGVQMDTEGWWSVTPEVLANHQSKLCRRYSGGYIALDAMAGCGGNVIAMARDFTAVYAIEISERRAGMIHHNVCLYGAEPKVEVVCADFFAAAPRMVADVIFVSPPWGGPKYKWCDSFQVLDPMEGLSFSIRGLLDTALAVVRRSTAPAPAPAIPRSASDPTPPPSPSPLTFVRGQFDLATIEALMRQPSIPPTPPPAPPPAPMPAAAAGAAAGAGAAARRGAAGGAPARGVVALFLPRNTDLHQLAGLVPESHVWQVERNYVNKRLKGITFYCFAQP